MHPTVLGTHMQSSADTLSCNLHAGEFTLLVCSAHTGLHTHHFCLVPGPSHYP